MEYSRCRFKGVGLLGVVLLSTMFSLGAQARTVSVDVVAIVEHPALDAIRDGAHDELKARGFAADGKLRWSYQSAQGNAATAAQIARKFIGDRPDVIVAIGTPAAQAVVAATRDVPVVYAGVTDPVAAQLVRTMGPSGTNVTGLSDALPIDQQIELIRRVAPGATRVGMVYNPGEVNSATVVAQLKDRLPRLGMRLVPVAAPRIVDVGPAAKSLLGKVDVIYTNTDNNVVSAYESVIQAAELGRVPALGSDPDAVRRGASAALGVDYYQMGRRVGALVARILDGAAPGTLASETMADARIYVNAAAATRQGATLSPGLLKEAGAAAS